MADADMQVLLKYYDKDGNKRLTSDEIAAIVSDIKTKPESIAEEVKAVLKKYDKDQDGKMDESELSSLVTEIKLADGNLRYAAYSASFARAFRYLAFTSDVG